MGPDHSKQPTLRRSGNVTVTLVTFSCVIHKYRAMSQYPPRDEVRIYFPGSRLLNSNSPLPFETVVGDRLDPCSLTVTPTRAEPRSSRTSPCTSTLSTRFT